MLFRRSSKRKVIIGDRKQVEQMLQHLGMIAEQADEGIVAVNLKGVVHFVNTAWATMHGYETSSELLGKQISVFHTKEQMKANVTALIKETERRGRAGGPAEHVRKDGTTFPTRAKMIMLKRERGKPAGIMVFAADMTERRRIEDELNQLRDQLQQRVEQQTAELTTANEQLQQEIAERRRTEDELNELRDQLQQRVEQQTAELTTANERLQQETAERRRVEDELNQLCGQLQHRVEQQTAELTTANEQLEQEVAGRRRTEDELNELRGQLQQRVEQQTTELTAANEQLNQAITERRQAAEEMRQFRDQFEHCVEELTAEMTTANEQMRREITERKQARETLPEDFSEEEAEREIELFDPDKLKALSDLAKRLG